MVRPKYKKFIASKQAENLEAYNLAKQRWLVWSEGSFHYDNFLSTFGIERAQAMVKDLKDDMDRLAKLAGVVT